jgi:hypothetical protein
MPGWSRQAQALVDEVDGTIRYLRNIASDVTVATNHTGPGQATEASCG